jgi:hypothetical protein
MYDWDMEANVGCMLRQSYKHPGGCKENFFALRDIHAGEELVVNYSFFAMAGTLMYIMFFDFFRFLA